MIFGAATSSFQIEGAWDEGGKGLSIWDVFTERDGVIAEGQNAKMACDHYHRYKEDVAIMKELSLDAYRFSISWPRILPEGVGRVNMEGIAFYRGLLEELNRTGITPFVTLYHWDLPQALQERGGFLNRDSALWFKYYTEVVMKYLGEFIDHIITFNEPEVFVGAGMKDGIFAPGQKLSVRELVQVSHNILLCHGKAVRVIRRYKPECKVGYAPTGVFYYPASDSDGDIEAARFANFKVDLDNFIAGISWWSDPVVLGKYPECPSELRAYLDEAVRDGDMEIISSPLDFYAQNIYQGKAVVADSDSGYREVPFAPGHPRTAIGWKVTPDVMYWVPKFLYERYDLPIYITENGMSCHDAVSDDGKVHDPNRSDFIDSYLAALKRAKDDGVPIEGYFYWSLLDNFEWANGYGERFGLVYVDFETGDRIIKDSGFNYKSVALRLFAN